MRDLVDEALSTSDAGYWTGHANEPEVIKASHFTDERIEEIQSGRSPLTAEERAFLLEDTPRFEECTHSADELAAMSDADLMTMAYRAWVDYCR